MDQKNLNFKNWGKSISRWFGGGSSGPPPNVSKYVGNLIQSDFAQGFGKMGVQSIIDGFDVISPGFSSTFDSFGGTDYLGIRPTDSQQAGYYTAMALTFISPGGAEAGAQKLTFKGLKNGLKGLGNIFKGGKTFAQYRTAYWADKTKPVLEPLQNEATGQIWKQYMELHHRFIPQKWKWAPNWLVNNRWNLQELNSLGHAMRDPYRARFAPKWVKDHYKLISK